MISPKDSAIVQAVARFIGDDDSEKAGAVSNLQNFLQHWDNDVFFLQTAETVGLKIGKYTVHVNDLVG